MTNQNFEFIGDERRGILKIVLRNHWDLAVVEQFKTAEQACVGDLSSDTAPARYRYLLIDASEHGVQSQEIVAALRDQIEGRKDIFDRTAIVIAGALHQMQAGRVRSNEGGHRLCGSVEDALAWLCPQDTLHARAA